MSEEFTGWAIVEIMGHRVMAGFCDHVRVAGTDMLRVTPPSNAAGTPGEPHILSGSAIFAIHPCTEDRAREVTHPAVPDYSRQLGPHHGVKRDDDDWEAMMEQEDDAGDSGGMEF